MYIVELEEGVFLAPGEGDPSRTLVKASAKRFLFSAWAARALTKAREFRLFASAKVLQAEPHPFEITCPVCGYYCLGNGGFGCIDKPSMLD